MDWYGPDKATFGERLVAAREKANLSQQDLAKRLGVKTPPLNHGKMIIRNRVQIAFLCWPVC